MLILSEVGFFSEVNIDYVHFRKFLTSERMSKSQESASVIKTDDDGGASNNVDLPATTPQSASLAFAAQAAPSHIRHSWV